MLISNKVVLIRFVYYCLVTMKKALFISLFIVVFSGCAMTANSLRSEGYSHPTQGESADLDKDFHICEVDAYDAGYVRRGGLIEASGGGRANYIRKCLASLGWQARNPQSN